MSGLNQESIALGIVGVTAVAVVARASQVIIFRPLANLLLKTGRVKWAMRMRRLGGQKGQMPQQRVACGKC